MSFEKKFRILDKRLKKLPIKHSSAVEMLAELIRKADKQIIYYKLLTFTLACLVGLLLFR